MAGVQCNHFCDDIRDGLFVPLCHFVYIAIVWWGSVVPYKNHMILRMIFRSGRIDIFGQPGSQLFS
jgi:hypothetical protein